MNEFFPVEFLPIVVFSGLLAIVGVILKATLKQKKHRQRELPHIRARRA